MALLAAALGGCTAEPPFGPPPAGGTHLTAQVDGVSFAAAFESACIGSQVGPASFTIAGRDSRPGSSAELALHLEGVTGPGRIPIRHYDRPTGDLAAVYRPDGPGQVQYAAPSGGGEVLIDEYDPALGTVAGRFYFNGLRVMGALGADWIEVREGSFRGRLAGPAHEGCAP